MPWDKEKLKKIVEGALFSSNQPMNLDRLGGLFFDEERPTKDEFKLALDGLTQDYAERGVILKEVASGYRFQVDEGVGEWVSRMWEEKPVRYSRALLETLALVAYRQPITRGEIEEIRGVSVSSHIMKTLLEREWVRVVGHRDVPGRPAMFATTRAFLDYFNLKNLVELPPLSEIRDFDKINEELELEDVVPGSGDSDNDSDSEDTNPENATSEDGSEENDSVANVETDGVPDMDEMPGLDVATETDTEAETDVVEALVSEDLLPEQKQEAVAKNEVVEEKPAVSTFAAIVKQFEANKAKEAEIDASDEAVASEAQIEEDLMVAEAVERQLAQEGEVTVGDLSREDVSDSTDGVEE